VRLVWGAWRPSGAAAFTFRALADRSLTSADDEELRLPEDGSIGLVHPLELSPERLAAWRAHLAEHAIEPPFPPLDRSVAEPTIEELAATEVTRHAGRQVHALSLRSRAERRGWTTATATGETQSFTRAFPHAGLEAVLEADGLFLGYGGYVDVKATL